MSYQKSKSKQENSLTSSSYYGSLGSDEIALDIFKTQPESSGIKVIETYITTEHNFPKMIPENKVDNSLPKMCKNCKKLFNESENTLNSCCYHKGFFKGDAFSYTLSDKKWTCCKSEVENSVGCIYGKHIASPELTGILNTFVKVPNEDGDETNSSRSPKGLESLKFAPKQPSQTSLPVTMKQPKVPDLLLQEEKKSKPKEKSKKSGDAASNDTLKELEFVFVETKTKKSTQRENSSPSSPQFRNGPINHEVQPSDTLQGLSLKYGVKVTFLKFNLILIGHFILNK